MTDQTVQIKYVGAEQRWPELSITGRQSVWMPGQIESRSNVEAASLLATGLFSSPPVPVTAVTSPGGGVEFAPDVEAAIAALGGGGGGPTSATTTSFIQTGTGAKTTTVAAKLQLLPDISDFSGVDKTGVTDSTDGINLALACGASVLTADAGIFKISGTIFVPAGVSLVGRGVGATVFDGSAASHTDLTNYRHITVGGGALSDLPPLSRDCKKGDRDILFSSAPSVDRGDVLTIFNATDFSWSGHRSMYRAGEIVRVARVVGNLVTLQGSLCDSYLAAAVTVSKRATSSTSLSDFTLRGLNSASAEITGILIEGCVDSSVQRVRSVGSSSSQLTVRSCYNTVLTGVTCEQDHVGSTSTSYGLVIANSHIVHVAGGHFTATRHGITTGGSTIFGGVTNRHISVVGAVIAMTGDAQALSFHGNTEYTTVDSCVIDGGFTGGGDHIKITNNHIKGSYNNGNVACYLAELRGATVDISGNTIESDQFTTGHSRGAFIDIGGNTPTIGPATRVGGVISIRNNMLIWSVSEDSFAAKPIRVATRGYVGAERLDCVIEGNTLISTKGARLGAATISTVAAAIDDAPWRRISVRNNDFSGGGGILISATTAGTYAADTCVIDNNALSEIDAGGIECSSIRKYCSIKANRIVGVTYGAITVKGEKCDFTEIVGNTAYNNMVGVTSSTTTNADIHVASARTAVVRDNVTGTANKKILVASVTGFVLGETITGTTSGATAKIASIRATTALSIAETLAGVFQLGETVTGGTSSASSTVTAVAADTRSYDIYIAAYVDKLLLSGNTDTQGATTRLAATPIVLPGSALYGSKAYAVTAAAGLSAQTTVAVAGASLGDHAVATLAADTTALNVTCWVSAADTVSVRFHNPTDAEIAIPSALLRADVTKR